VEYLSLENHLTQKEKTEAYVPELVRLYEAVKSDMRKYLPSIAEKFPHYSRHDFQHVESILENIEIILGNERIKQLTVGDTWLILMSAYLHDIGMLISYEEEKTAWKSEAFAKFLLACEYGDDKDLRNAARIALGEDIRIDPLLAKNYVIQLTAEFFRRKHTERSKEIITGESCIGKLLSFDIPDSLQNVWECIGRIIKLHGSDFEDVLNEKQFRNFPLPRCGNYHPRFVAVLLRLGDLCDVKRGRFNSISLEQFGKLPEASLKHFYKHKT